MKLKKRGRMGLNNGDGGLSSGRSSMCSSFSNVHTGEQESSPTDTTAPVVDETHTPVSDNSNELRVDVKSSGDNLFLAAISKETASPMSADSGISQSPISKDPATPHSFDEMRLRELQMDLENARRTVDEYEYKLKILEADKERLRLDNEELKAKLQIPIPAPEAPVKHDQSTLTPETQQTTTTATSTTNITPAPTDNALKLTYETMEKECEYWKDRYRGACLKITQLSRHSIHFASQNRLISEQRRELDSVRKRFEEADMKNRELTKLVSRMALGVSQGMASSGSAAAASVESNRGNGKDNSFILFE